MREKWTDERLDDQKGRVDDLAHEVRVGFTRIDERLDRMQAQMMQMMLVMLTGFIGLAGLILTQG